MVSWYFLPENSFGRHSRHNYWQYCLANKALSPVINEQNGSWVNFWHFSSSISKRRKDTIMILWSRLTHELPYRKVARIATCPSNRMLCMPKKLDHKWISVTYYVTLNFLVQFSLKNNQGSKIGATLPIIFDLACSVLTHLVKVLHLKRRDNFFFFAAIVKHSYLMLYK